MDKFLYFRWSVFISATFFYVPSHEKTMLPFSKKKSFFNVPCHKNDFNPRIKWRKQEKENTERKRLKNLNNAHLPHFAKNSLLVLNFSKFSSTFVFSHEYLIHWKSKSITSIKVPFHFQRSSPKKMLHWWRRTIENAGIPPSWTPCFTLPPLFFQSKKVMQESFNTNKNVWYGHHLEYLMKKKRCTFFVWIWDKTLFDIHISRLKKNLFFDDHQTKIMDL